MGLKPEDYDNHRNVMYRIQLGDSRKIKLKFKQEAGFGMEWHRNCGYDKVHIFTGRADDLDQDRDDFEGFVLEYESEPTGLPDFTDFATAAETLHKMVLLDTLKYNLKNTRPPLVAAENLYNTMINRSKQNK